MATFTISIPEDLKKRIENYPDINLAEYLKICFKKRLIEFERFEELKRSGKLLP